MVNLRCTVIVDLTVFCFNRVFSFVIFIIYFHLVSTCEKGWYGHILHNKCYKILNVKQNYREAEKQCSTMGADVIEGRSEFERTFSLLAVSMDGTLFRGVYSISKNNCSISEIIYINQLKHAAIMLLKVYSDTYN